MVYKINFNKDECRGCGACTFCDNWKMDDNGKAYPVNIELDSLGCNQEAADVCPVNIIKINEE